MRLTATLTVALVALLCIAAAAAPARAQMAPCLTPGFNEMDFWVGTWDLEWPGGQGGTPEGETGSGTNVIQKDLDGCVVREQFRSEAGYLGESLSAYDASTGLWRQTWVDNQGAYLLFTGARLEDPTEGTFALRTEPFVTPDGVERVNRMVWQGVTAEALTWRWQTSADGGDTWSDQWVVRYTRRPNPAEQP